tara:strand:- start:611 stop:766 length:156 start_codon:yes stop_codon:yes gene_type:complete
MKGSNILVAENSVLNNHEMDYTLIAGPNLIAWKYPARDALKALPQDTIEYL